MVYISTVLITIIPQLTAIDEFDDENDDENHPYV